MQATELPVPGFADLQVNGYRSVDFSSPELTEDSFVNACRDLLASGLAGFLPTIITSSTDIYERNLRLMSTAMRRDELGRSILGIHAEGPFISPEPGALGAHSPRHVRLPDLDFLDKMIEWSDNRLRLLTVAAELPNAPVLISHAVKRGLTVSIGHSLASSKQLCTAAEAGARVITHLGNAVPSMLPRHPNPLWAGLANDRLSAMLITDGHHVPVELIKTALRAKGIQRSIVVSDAAPLSGLAPGTYTTLGNAAILAPDGKLYNPKTNYLVGSSATMLQCMNYLAGLDLVSLDELMALGFYNPLKLLGLDPAELNSRNRLLYDSDRRTFEVRQA